jgi:2'-5' RNA ligase
MSSPPPPSARLFLALWPPPQVRDALVESVRHWPWPDAARLTRPERLHATLHFIGSVPLGRLDEARRALSVPFEPFEWDFTRPEVWRGGIAVLCPAEVPAALARLHEALGVRLRQLELPVEERPYRPHVTLARKAQALKAPAQVAAVRWRAEHGYHLVRTLPGGQGYESLARFG